MFRHHKNLFTAATILALVLLSSLPAAAAGSSPVRNGEGAWESLVSEALSWLGAQGSGLSAIWSEYSAMIDPLGQPAPNTTNSDYSSMIDPNGRP